MYVYRNNEARSRNHRFRGKPRISTYSECVSVVLVIRHAKRMRRIILSSVACPVVPLCIILSHKSGPGSSVGIATGYGLDGPGIESRWE